MIITDINGNKLSLTTAYLKQIKGHEPDEGVLLTYGRLRLSDLKDALKTMKAASTTGVRVTIDLGRSPEDYDSRYVIIVNPTFHRIGCRTFTPKTYARIMKAVKNSRPERGSKRKS
jgi:hypothetical protein